MVHVTSKTFPQKIRIFLSLQSYKTMAKTIKQEIIFTEYPSEDALDDQSRELIAKAREASTRAYAPYSNFQVGAALLLENGEIITGNNQENACYPDGLCAERVAFFAAKSQRPELEVLEVAVVAQKMGSDVTVPVAPCGSCRQVMSEYENNQQSSITVLMPTGDGKVYACDSIDALLPFKFSKDSLTL